MIRRKFIQMCVAGFVPVWVWSGVARVARSYGRPLEAEFLMASPEKADVGNYSFVLCKYPNWKMKSQLSDDNRGFIVGQTWSVIDDDGHEVERVQITGT